MPDPIRLVVPIDSQDPSAWQHALAYASAIGTKAESTVHDLILLTHAKQQLASTSLGTHVGDGATRKLLSNEPVPLQSGGRLRHATPQTLRGAGRGAVFVAYYADDAMLETLDGIAGIAGIVAVPDLPGDVDGWIARWNPLIHGQQQAAEAPPLIRDTVVVNALRTLTGRINLSNAVMNPRDKEHADEVLRILKANGHAFDPAMIKSWAIREGWKPGAAEELAKLAARIGALKGKPPLGRFHDPRGKYARWSA